MPIPHLSIISLHDPDPIKGGVWQQVLVLGYDITQGDAGHLGDVVSRLSCWEGCNR